MYHNKYLITEGNTEIDLTDLLLLLIIIITYYHTECVDIDSFINPIN